MGRLLAKASSIQSPLAEGYHAFGRRCEQLGCGGLWQTKAEARAAEAQRVRLKLERQLLAILFDRIYLGEVLKDLDLPFIIQTPTDNPITVESLLVNAMNS